MTQTIKDYFTRPQRQVYYPFDLGPSVLLIEGKKYVRDDFHILNKSNHKLSVSFFYPQDQSPQNCVVYLHTHNGSKLEALPLAQRILSLGVNLCLFDFAGYGNSEGVTVTLGSKEIWDIQIVLNYLKEKYHQFKFILWGRSMGAVAALLYLAARQVFSEHKEQNKRLKRQNEVVGGIYDSPFHSLQKLTVQIGSKTSNLPQFLLTPLVYIVKSSLKEQINFDDLELVEKVKNIKIPGIFIASHQDNFVHYSHSQILYKQYGGKKELIYIERDHNQIRKQEDLVSIFTFIRKIHQQNPKRWQNVLIHNLNFHRKVGFSVNSLYSESQL